MGCGTGTSRLFHTLLCVVWEMRFAHFPHNTKLFARRSRASSRPERAKALSIRHAQTSIKSAICVEQGVGCTVTIAIISDFGDRTHGSNFQTLSIHPFDHSTADADSATMRQRNYQFNPGGSSRDGETAANTRI